MIDLRPHDAVTEIHLDRPPVNALTTELLDDLATAVREAVDAGARALVLSGREGFFSAGLDLPFVLAQDEAGRGAMIDALFAAMRAIALAPVPTVAAITGHSPAGGAVLAIWCDCRVMARGPFKIGLNEVEVGVPLPEVLVAGVARLVGRQRAARLLIGAELPEAEEAWRIGLVDELVEPSAVVDRALAVAARWATLPVGPLAETRRIARADLVGLFAELDGQRSHFVDAFGAEPAQRAMGAIVERLKRR